MFTFSDLINNFFTHKDYLPAAQIIPGTMFTPLHFLFSAFCLSLTVFFFIKCAKSSKSQIKTVFTILWAVIVVLEFVKIVWESLSGKVPGVEWSGVMPLYPCSIYMYAMPFAIWGRGIAKKAACGYVCTLGLLGGAINFVYPATILGSYSCISFAGFHTFLYHGAIVFTAFTMLLSGYHSFTGVRRFTQLLIPSVPFLVVSVIANAVNFSPIASDYMFFKLDSFIFAPIGAALPKAVCVIIAYLAYLLIHALPYLPSYFLNKKKQTEAVNT